MLNVELVQRENANFEVMDLPLKIQKIAPQHRCKHCDFYSGFSSSKKTLNCPEVNTRFVYGMRQIGKGFSAEFKLCGTLNLPRLSKTAYTNHENKLMSVISEVSELSMQKAASELLVLHPTKNKIVECGISVDGTWQRRGYSSMNGCVAALSVDTGKLTDSSIDRLQNYYGIAVRINVGNLSGLQQNVIAALFHCSSSVEKPMHGQCPIGKDSWCYYQRALSCGKKPKEKYKGLSNEVLNMIKPTYLELCTKELLTKCLHGKTQNSNECLNGVIWQRVPKEVFVCLKTIGCCDPI
ncbi:uncharacterized protein TNCV_1996961 [Trichonephila clavipes]|uniref:Mutator-like transposase domain-containing protein n=1 Tax=Trichonephila clavipes TaxID=2585209 RepID=A0A8X6RQL6_TRICX|nr:uncharacterized protein TNCV_1996961 [Trichonephila clavipes]